MHESITLDRLLELLPRGDDPFAATPPSGVRYIGQANPGFVAPTLRVERPIQTGATSVILIAAPAAVGKSTLAAELAYRTGSMLWDLAHFQVGTHTFSGTILDAFDARAAEALQRIGSGDFLVILDALDEALVRAGSPNFDAFLENLRTRLTAARSKPSVVLLARNETAEEVNLWLDDGSVPYARYEIDFFDENRAVDFIIRKLDRKRAVDGKQPVHRTQGDPFAEARKAFFSFVYSLLGVTASPWSDARVRTFLGYAPVLEAVAEYLDVTNYHRLTQDLRERRVEPFAGDFELQWAFLSRIITELLEREREKAGTHVRSQIAPEAGRVGWSRWESLYQREEQCERIIARVLRVSPSTALDGMPQALVSRYEEALAPFVSQHPFLGPRYGFAGPVFQEYVYAWSLVKGPRVLAEHLRTTLVAQGYQPSPLLGRFCITMVRERENTRLDGRDLGLVYESFASHRTESGGVTTFVFGDQREVVALFAIGETEIEVPVAPNEDGVHFWRRLADADVHAHCPVTLGVPGKSFRIGPAVDLWSTKLRTAFESMDADVRGDVLLACELHEPTGFVHRVRLLNETSGKLKLDWPEMSYPWAQYRASLGRTYRNRDSVKMLVLRKFLLMFRRQRGRRISTVESARWAPHEHDARDQLIQLAKSRGVLKVESPYYIFNSDYDSLKSAFDEASSFSADSATFLKEFLGDDFPLVAASPP